MQVHPTRATFHAALAGAALVALGVAVRSPYPVAFGGAMLLAVMVGRSLALVTVAQIRASGLEMVWLAPRRVTRTSRGGEIVLTAELRNRGSDDARGVNLRPVASSYLDVTVEPETLDLPAASRVSFAMRVRPRRIGRWGIHGIALEVRGRPLAGDGLYEVPLMFANPHGVEVLPAPLGSLIETARGGRSRVQSAVGRTAAQRGDGDALRELREHVPGDPFKRIAWKASARRGKLLVREMEREERDVVMLLVDASVELWAGPAGRAPLDLMLEEVAAVARRYLGRGDPVGLAVYASRLRAWLEPDAGPRQAAEIATALTSAANLVDADRTELDEADVARRVAEHLRPLDPKGLTDIGRANLDALAARADAMRARAPFDPRPPHASTAREARLRRYLAAFGIEAPPRIDGERDRSDAELAVQLGRVAALPRRGRPSTVHVFAPAPVSSAVDAALTRLRRERVEVRWTLPSFEPGLEEAAGATVTAIVSEAVRARVRAAETRGARHLRTLGVRVDTRAHARVASPSETTSDTTWKENRA